MPTYKANDNAAFIPERFYVQMFLKENGVSRNELTKYTENYKCHDLISQEITNKHSKYIKSNFNNSLEEANKCLTKYRSVT